MLRAFVLAVIVAASAYGLGAVVSPEMSAGALLGACVGGAASLAAMWRVRRALATKPERGMQVLVEGFLAKLGLLGLSIVAFRVVDGLEARCDWRGYLLAFGTAAVCVLFAAVYEMHQARMAQLTRVNGQKGSVA